MTSLRWTPIVLAALLTALPTSPGVAQAPRSAIATVTAGIAADIRAKAADAVIFAGPLESDEHAPRGSDLVAKVQALVAGALGPRVNARPERVTLAAAQSLGHKAKALVYLKVEVARGEVRLSADLYRMGRTVWERIKQPSVMPMSHAFASARMDAEVRGYLAPVPILAKRVERAAIEDRDIMAVACGDVDSDGALELFVVSRRRVAVGRVRGGRFAALGVAQFADLSPIAPAPLREPLAGVVVLQGRPGVVDVGITDRARGSRLDGKLRPVGSIAGVPFTVPEGDACLTFQGTTLNPIVKKCADEDPAFEPVDVAPGVDAIVRVTTIGSDGTPRVVDARRDPISRDVVVRAGTIAASLPRSGAQVAIADLDGDGDPEIVSTLDALASAGPAAVDDAVVIRSLRTGGRLEDRARVPVPSGVRAIAACPPDAPGPAPIVVATAGELWVVR